MNRCAISILFSSIVAAGMAHGDNTAPRRFDAVLSGSEAVPAPVDSQMEGRAGFEFNSEETAMLFVLTLTNGVNVTGIQLHCGPIGMPGPAIVPLLTAIQGSWDGTLEVQSTITGANIIQGVDCVSTTGRNIGTLAALAATMRDGNIFVNVTSVAFPEGEIRGQVQATSGDLNFLSPSGTSDSTARVPLQIGGESGTIIRIVPRSPEATTPPPTTFNPPLREFPSSSFNPPLRDPSTFSSSGFNPPLETSP